LDDDREKMWARPEIGRAACAARVAINVSTRAALYDKKNKHRCQLEFEFAPAGSFHGGSFGVSGTPPGARLVGRAKPLDWKARGEESDNTGP
jgi:hypothetical protein